LFSGIGGIDLGFDLAGFECAWQVEVDEHCRRILEQHWPEVPKYKDIYEVKGSEIEPVDILCGGFPCQPVSVAGKRGGVNDERWLWDEFYRLICELRPRWVVAENVTGLLSANSGRAFAGVLRDLAEGGYDAVWDVYPAGGPGGVGAPHRRERVFIVAHTDSSKQTKESGDVREVSGVSQEVGEDISAVVSGRGSEDVADTKGKRHGRWTGKKRRITKRELQQEKQRRSKVGSEVKGRSGSHGDVANTKCIGQQRSRSSRKWSSSETYGERQADNAFTVGINNQWGVEPNVGRVANGVSNRVDRLRALGNGVVPQVAYKVARMIYEYTKKEK
jgi:DNA (cytosine-5)-methyltransferase 1